MRFPPGTLGLLVVGAGLAGCTQTGGLRAVTPSDVKTTASVGDKPLPAVAGLPGDERRAGEALPEAPRISSARISGRVYDDQGEPVRNAVVRLAVTGAAGGRAVHATTDRSGAFTLRGVRPGSSYTVIAEYQGEQGMMTGRAEAEAPDTGVRISLHSRDAVAGADAKGGVASPPARPRAQAVARAEERETEEFDDLPDPEPPRRTAARPSPAKPRLDTTDDERDGSAARGWSQRGTTPKPRASARPADEEPAEDEEPADLEDDGENPLPPAREISKVSARMEDPYPAEEDEPGTLPDELVDQTSGDAAEGSRPVRKSARPSNPPVERARPTWSEVVSESGQRPVDAALAQASAAVPKPPAPEPSAALRAAAPPGGTRTSPYCDYDADGQKMLDFAKFDVDGKLVSIRDFDADLILLDFWGSWCAPCRTSIPHLKELQDRLGGKKLQVVSVAYEQVAPAERGARLKALSKELGINYPILVAGLQDDDAVRSALQVWFYPTMILLDREGRVVRREAGATELTLANIDRAIADHLERAAKPQLARREPKGRPTAAR